MVSLLVFAIAAGLAVTLFARYGRVVRFADEHSQWTSILVAGERMRQELREARVMEVGEREVRLTKLDPQLFEQRLDLDRPATVAFDPYADEFMVKVRYSLLGDQLLRTLERSGQEPLSAAMVGGLSGLELGHDGEILTFRLRYKTDTRTHEVAYLVEMP
jgi:hypothetical protein